MSLPKVGPIFVALPPLFSKYYIENPINRNLSGSGKKVSKLTIQDYLYSQNLYEVSPQCLVWGLHILTKQSF